MLYIRKLPVINNMYCNESINNFVTLSLSTCTNQFHHEEYLTKMYFRSQLDVTRKLVV